MKYLVWDCKLIIPADSIVPDGFNNVPRRAAIDAVEALGIAVKGCFSGWGGKLTEIEESIIENSPSL